MSSADRAASLIQSRLAEIEDEAGRLRRVLEHLDPGRGGRSRSRRSPGPNRSSKSSGSKSAGRSRRSSKRAGRGERQKQLLATIKTMRGASANELADAMGVGATQVYGLLRQAESKGLIAKKGQGFRVTA
jgi:hypothetical protein